MIHPLLAKELRDQRPFLGLALFFLVTEVAHSLWTEPLGFSAYAQRLDDLFGFTGELSMLTSLLAFSLGSGLLVREQDDRTLEFLDSLPTSRATLFGVKVGVALATVLVFPFGLMGWTLCQRVLSLTSLDDGLHLGVMGVGAVLLSVQVLTVLALALALSPLRRLSWTVLALLGLGLFYLEAAVPSLSLLNPLRLSQLRLVGEHWVWPLRALGFHVPVMAGLLAVSLLGFLGVGASFAESLRRWLQGTWGGPLVTGVTVALSLFGIVQWGERLDSPAPMKDASGMTFPTSVSAHAETRHYVFTYPASQSERARPLVAGADAVFEQVRAFLAVEAGAPIAADLSGSQKNTSGTAFWNTLRMRLPGAASEDDLRDTLAHETIHVFAQRLCGSARDSETLSGMRVFNEGLAEYGVARVYHPRGAPEDVFEDQLVAAARLRGEVRIEELLDPEQLDARQDGNWSYPLGRRFIAALVRRHGERAPERVIRSLCRPDAPKNLTGAPAWQDAFQTAGMDLSRVFDDFFAELDEAVVRHRAFLDALPRPGGSVERREGWLGVRLRLDQELPEGWTVVCRFRERESDSAYDFDGPEFVSKDSPCWRDASRIAEGRLWYQLGVIGPAAGVVLYEPWVSVPVEGL